MPKYRRKSITLEAVQFKACEAWPAGVVPCVGEDIGHMTENHNIVAAVFTTGGWCVLEDGDWIVTQGNGKLLVVKEGVFENTFEPVVEGGA